MEISEESEECGPVLVQHPLEGETELEAAIEDLTTPRNERGDTGAVDMPADSDLEDHRSANGRWRAFTAHATAVERQVRQESGNGSVTIENLAGRDKSPDPLTSAFVRSRRHGAFRIDLVWS